MADLNLTQLATKLKQTAGLDNLQELTRLIVLINNKLETKIKTVGAEIKGSFRMAVVAAFPDPTNATEMLNLWQSVGGTTPAKNDYLEVSLEDFSKHALYHYDGAKWVKGAERTNHILAGIDLSAYDTTDTLKLIFAQMGSIAELDTLLSGGTVTDSDKKTLVLDQIKILVQNIKNGTQSEYAQFADDLFYKTPEVIEYRDRDTKLTSLDAEVGTTGNAVRYSTLIKPLDRIYNEGSSFELTMNQDNMEVEYLFITHSKGLKFVGNIGDTYKWETILKNNVKYIKFTGTATLKITDTPLSTSTVWADQALPFEIPVADLIDDINNTAIVQMTFGTLPALASKIAHIDYVTSLKYYEDRNSSFLNEILRREAYNFPTNMSEQLTYEIYNGKPHIKYGFAGTKAVITHSEVIRDETNGITLTFKDLIPVKERLGKINTSFTLIPAKACTFTYEHPTNAAKKIEIGMAALSEVTFEHVSETQFKVSTDQTLKVDGHIVIPVPKSEAVLNFADYMDTNGMMKVFNHYAAGVTINPSDAIASLAFKTYDEFTTRGLLASLQNHINEADKKFVHKAFEQTPTFSHQAGFIVGSEGDLNTYNIGDQIVIDLSGIDTINSAPGAIGNSDVLFFGGNSVKQNIVGVETGLKWKTKTNATEYNIEENYLTKNLKVEKKDGYYLLVEWVDKPVKPAEITLNNVSVDDLKKALQRAGVDLTTLSHILSDAMGSSTAPTTRGDGSPLQAGDWYVDNNGATHIYGASGFITQNAPTLDQASILTLLGLTADQLNNVLKVTKVFTDALKTKYDGYEATINGKQERLTPAQLAILVGVVYSQIDKNKVDNLPANTNAKFNDYQLLLTSAQKLAIAKLFITEADKAKYDGYDARINDKIGSDSNRIGNAASTSDTMVFRKTGEHSGQSYTYVGGSYVGAFNGASKLAVVKMDGNTPKLVGNDGTNDFDIPFGNILEKDLTNLDNNVLIQKLQAAGVQTQIFNEFKGVLASAPAGAHNDLDWYINDSDFHLYVWHNNKWNSVGNTTSAVDKQLILNLLGITEAQLDIFKTTKEFTQAEKNKLANALTEHQDISGKANISYVDGELNKKANDGVSYTKSESDAKYLTSHQDISGKADKTLNNVSISDFAAKLQQAGINAGIFNEFKGVLGSAPGGTHKDLDWFISSSDNHIYLWHTNKWNSVGGGASATLDKAAILNLLGLTSISQNQLALPSSSDSTMEFKSAGDYLGKINTTTSGAYMGLFKGGAQQYAAIRLENQIPKLFGRDASGLYNIPFADIAKKDLSNITKADALAKLGITQTQLNKALILAGKTLTQSTLTFDDNTTKTVFILE